MVINGLELYRWERAGYLIRRGVFSFGAPVTPEFHIPVVADLLSVAEGNIDRIQFELQRPVVILTEPQPPIVILTEPQPPVVILTEPQPPIVILTEPQRREESAFDVAFDDQPNVKNRSFVPQDDVKGGSAVKGEWSYGDSSLSPLVEHDPAWHPHFVDVIAAVSQAPILLKVAPGSHIEPMPISDLENIMADLSAEMSCAVLVTLNAGDILYLHSHVLRKMHGDAGVMRFVGPSRGIKIPC